MDSELLDDEKYEELLRSRDKELTSSQIHDLRKIDRVEVMLNLYEDELSQDIRNETFKILRRRQMEILTNEEKGTSEQLSDLLPDSVQIALGL
ncbi:hypothetical protein [Haloarchaeobius litoreus]|uniref:Uncharacterized protein n=1 Tax=Haloarchaeobius litoreus TaxID=755306 RepID=A0ABD6DNK0_9EURY|nr:hypothetical protein [Haloarchaeobius litoreus]